MASPVGSPQRPARNGLQLLEERIGLPALFATLSSAIGVTAGFLTGGVTAVMTNLADTPMARPHILRTTRTFGTGAGRMAFSYHLLYSTPQNNIGLLGIVHGLVGAGIILARGHDDYFNRAVSGCTAGLALGISRTEEIFSCAL